MLIPELFSSIVLEMVNFYYEILALSLAPDT